MGIDSYIRTFPTREEAEAFAKGFAGRYTVIISYLRYCDKWEVEAF